MKQCAIIINAYSNLESSLNQSKRLKEEFAKLNVKTDILRNTNFFAYIENNGELINKLEKYDFIVYLDKDKYLSEALEKKGMRLFNRHQSIRDCDDKVTSFIQLSDNGIPMPKTYPGLLCYNPEIPVNKEALDIIEQNLGYPIIVKESYGSCGNRIYKADNRTELEEFASKLKCRPHLFQQYIESSKGKDIRVMVIANKVVASILRKSDVDFRSNLALGATGSNYPINDDLKEMCEKISKILNLDYCGIDILFGKNDSEYFVCEVNSNAFFGVAESCTGINIAKLYAEHIYNCIYNK